jgi:hypothetical protein
MPIRPENRKRYPPNWRNEIVPAIRIHRAGNRCEWIDPATGERCAARHMEPNHRNPKAKAPVRLTIAHLDHTPENCDPANLAAWCELHHIRYDAPRKAADRRVRKSGEKP